MKKEQSSGGPYHINPLRISGALSKLCASEACNSIWLAPDLGLWMERCVAEKQLAAGQGKTSMVLLPWSLDEQIC